MRNALDNEAKPIFRPKMGSSVETKSRITNSRFYMENVSTTCNVCVKRCSTLMSSRPVSSAVEKKQNGAPDRSRKEDTSRQNDLVGNADLPVPPMKSSCSYGQDSNIDTSNLLNACSSGEMESQSNSAVKDTDSPGDETSCISRIDTAHASRSNANRKNDGSGSSSSVDSFLPCEKAVNGHQGNPEESVNNLMGLPIEGGEPCKESSLKAEASVLSEEKGDSSCTTILSRGAAEASELSDSKILKVKQCLPIEQPHGTELPVPSQLAENISGAVTGDEDVRVCDICGDVGREDLLTTCTKCNDGAEHIYCMRIRMMKVPVGDWLCEECEINQKSKIEREKKVLDKFLKRSSSMATTRELESLGSLNVNKKLHVDVGASDFKKRTISAVSSLKSPCKTSLGNSEAFQIIKRKRLEMQYTPGAVRPKEGLFPHSKSSSPTNLAEGIVRPLPLSGSGKSTCSFNKASLLKSRFFNICDLRVKDVQQQQGCEKALILRDCGKEGRSRVFCKSQSFKDVHREFSGSGISKANKTLLSTSPRVKDRIRLWKTEDQSASPQKSTARLGSTNTKDNNIASDEELVSKASTAACDVAEAKLRGYEHLSNSSKSKRFKAQEGSGDLHVENQRSIKKLKAELPAKTHELDVNRFPRRACLVNILVPPKTVVIPLIDFMWKGGFEVSRSGGLGDLFPSIQAHKSNVASDKVDDIVVKFPQKILLDEVPRLSAWPTQFTNNQVMESNIALYFFPESLESYGAYKGLLKRMAGKNLALKGFLDGIELLIFSSEVLPPKCQRWNNSVYLWGVFRMTSVKSFMNETASENQQFSPGSLKPQPPITGIPLPEKEPASQNQQCSQMPSTGSSEPLPPVIEEIPTEKKVAQQNQYCSPETSIGSVGLPPHVAKGMLTEKELASQNQKISPRSSPGSSGPHSLIKKEMLTLRIQEIESFTASRIFSSLQTSNSGALPRASPTRISEAREQLASSSKVKASPMPENAHQLNVINSSPIPAPVDGRNACRTRDFDLNIADENSSWDPSSSSCFDGVRPDKKMKGIVIEPPEPCCSQEVIELFELSPLFYAKDLASTSGSAAIRSTARDKEHFSFEDVDLELSLGHTNLMGKRKVSINFDLEPVHDITYPTERLRAGNGESSSMPLSLSLAPPS